MTLGAFAFIAAAAGAALAVQAPASVGATDRAAIEQIVHDYILDHPEIIPQAIEKLQAKRLSGVIDASRSALETPYAGAWEGAADADVTVVEFFDYACGYCRASLPDLGKLVGSDKKVKIVYRELPILSEESGDAAKVSLLAAERGQYMAYHKALYGAGRVTRDTILAAAAKAGISKADAEAAIASIRDASRPLAINSCSASCNMCSPSFSASSFEGRPPLEVLRGSDIYSLTIALVRPSDLLPSRTRPLWYGQAKLRSGQRGLMMPT